MKKVFVFCIGGTGLRVMKSITMLLAAGADTNGYAVVPVIIDPHLDLAEKKNLVTLIDSYRRLRHAAEGERGGTPRASATPQGFFQNPIVTLGDLNDKLNDTQQAGGSNEAFASYLGTAALAADDPTGWLLQTLFSSKNLTNRLSVGFKGNPNVGTVVLGDQIQNADWLRAFETHCEQDDRVFIISSIFGGTGASGYPLLVKKIQGAENFPAVRAALIGAVTVLPYYGLRDPATSGSDIDSANFYTKAKAALAYYEDNVRPDLLYYVGEGHLRQVYDNDEAKQEDTANFTELVAATALLDFLGRSRPDKPQFLRRAIEEDADTLDLATLGTGYRGLVKAVADMALLAKLVEILPKERQYPLAQSRGLDGAFYEDAAFKDLEQFTARFSQWYGELSHNNRAFAPLNADTHADISGRVRGITLGAKDITYYLLQLIKAARREKGHPEKFPLLMRAAYAAINHYTKKITE